MIERGLRLLVCPLCKSNHSTKEWDNKTISTCGNRRVRRTFKSLELESSRTKGSRRTYVCPSCTSFVDGNKIKIKDSL